MPRAPRRRHIASVSRLKALLSLIENFSRLTLVNAGSTSAKWKHIVPGWVIAAGKGTSTAIGSLISTTFASASVNITAKNPAPGVGPAFWVTDSGNYWSVTRNVVNICQSCTACGAYNSCVYCSSYGEIAQQGCTQSGTCPASVCNGGYSSCPAEGCNGGAHIFIAYKLVVNMHIIINMAMPVLHGLLPQLLDADQLIHIM